ncbi:Dirigent protein 23 [Abeliophyllum distichum]|uniref:Dirigent protein n=1 Tax=Abeliophyllum distichum TaxID=126358 RepID=A0ABD1RTF9_9LAMI
MVSFISHTLFILYLIIFTISITCSTGILSEDIFEAIAKKRMAKTSHLHFYFHDIISGENPTAVKIIRGNELGFGTTYMIDDVLTESPDRSLKLIGRAQGMYSLASQHDLGLLMIVNFVFTDGKYNGNSLSMLGNNHVLENVREMPIVGGSGIFRLAKGYALAHTIWFDQKTGDAIVEYNVTVQHF